MNQKRNAGRDYSAPPDSLAIDFRGASWQGNGRKGRIKAEEKEKEGKGRRERVRRNRGKGPH